MKQLLILAAVAWMILGGPAGAADLIAVDAADAPFMYAVDDQAAGIYPLVIAEAYRRLGLEVSVVAMPWKRALDGADQGQNGVAGLYKTEARLEKYDYSEKLLDETLLVYVRAGHGFAFKSIEDLKGRSVGVIRGWSYGDDFDTARRNGWFTVEEASGDEQNFSILEAGHIDCILAIREAATAAIAVHGWQDRFDQLPMPLSSNPSYIAFAKTAGKRDQLKRFDQIIAGMRADGSFERLTATAFTQ